MVTKSIIKASEYHDSVSLMAAARELSNMEGVEDVAVVMGTDANKAPLGQANLLTPEASGETVNDLVIVIKVAEDMVDAAIARSGRLLKPFLGSSDEMRSHDRPLSIHAAVKKIRKQMWPSYR